MRIWTLHPKYLDPQGLVALWREALLARAVLRGKTRGYKHHPQLERFRAHGSSRLAINTYLVAIRAEALLRGYHFDKSKVGPVRAVPPIPATTGQLHYEWEHLLRKLETRSPSHFSQWRDLGDPECHPLFSVHPGPIATWERPSESLEQAVPPDIQVAALSQEPCVRRQA